ncbi:MAG: WD40/YVTN/BNR-like repeat-containing protein [Candidatus Cryosericum sp.]
MKYAGRILIVVMIVFVLGVFWYAISGQAFLMRTVLTNDASVAEGTIWVQSDQGLYGGPVTAIAVVPSQTAVVFAGTKGDETYVSSDAGSTWRLLGGSSSGHYVTGIVASAVSGGTRVGKAVYGEGYFLSQDGGQTWRRANRGLGSRSLSCLAAATDEPEVIFVGTGDAGLYVSRDGGRSWKRTGRVFLGDGITCVAVSRDGLTVFAGTQDNGLSVSRDGGTTWTKVTLPFGSQPIVTGIDIEPTNETRIAVCLTGGGAGVSSDGGKTWIRSRAGLLPSDCAAVQFAPGREAGLVVGTQSGAVWFSPDGMGWHIVHELPEGGRVYALATVGNVVLAATSHGVLSSLDGTTWQESSTGITNLTLSGLAVSPVRPETMFAATDDGVYSSLDAGTSWTRSSVSEGVLSVVVLPDGGTVLAGTADGRVLRTVDGGRTWSHVTRGIPGMKVSILVALPGQPRTVCTGTNNGFAISYDAGQTWIPRNIGLVARIVAGEPDIRIEVAALIADPQRPGTVVLALLGQGLFASSDEGLRWKSVQPGPTTPWIDSLAEDVSAGRMYAGTDTDGVIVSRDGGTTWSAAGKGLSTILSVSGAVNSIATTTDGTAYAGTAARGVARSSDGGATWQRINSGLPDIDVRHIVVEGTTVYALTAHRLVRLSSR